MKKIRLLMPACLFFLLVMAVWHQSERRTEWGSSGAGKERLDPEGIPSQTVERDRMARYSVPTLRHNRIATETKSKSVDDSTEFHAARCDAFRQWFRQQSVSLGGAQADAGLELLTARRESVAWLIRNNPREAMSQALSFAERSRLPKEWLQHVEERFSEIAELQVLPDCSTGPQRTGTRIQLIRKGAETLKGIPWGELDQYLSKNRLPVEGVALEGWTALAENGFRILTGEELSAAKGIFPAADASQAASQSGATALVGGVLTSFSPADHAREIQHLYPTLAALPGPHSAEPLLAAYGNENTSPNQILSAATELASSWTETPKTVLVINTIFPDKTTPVKTQAEWQQVMSEVSKWLSENAYGKPTC